MKRLVLAIAVLLGLTSVAGCAGPTFSSLPLPGSGVSGSTVTVRADFDDALNLAHGALVKVNGVEAGRVTDVSVHDFHARVTMTVQRSAQLRRGATVSLRYTTPLGELFVDVHNPRAGALLADGTLLPRDAASTAPTVEDALSETSILINGGGLGQLQTITSELDRALAGRTGTVRDLMARAKRTLGQLNASTDDFDATLHALDSVSRVLDHRRQTIHAALRRLGPAADAVRADLGRITRFLHRLEKFARTANGVVDSTRDQVLQLVRQAGPTLREMASTASVLPVTLRALVSLAGYLSTVIPTDYLNLGTHFDIGTVRVGSKSGPVSLGDTLHKLVPSLGGGTSTAAAAPLSQQIIRGVTDQLLQGLLKGSR